MLTAIAYHDCLRISNRTSNQPSGPVTRAPKKRRTTPPAARFLPPFIFYRFFQNAARSWYIRAGYARVFAIVRNACNIYVRNNVRYLRVVKCCVVKTFRRYGRDATLLRVYNNSEIFILCGTRSRIVPGIRLKSESPRGPYPAVHDVPVTRGCIIRVRMRNRFLPIQLRCTYRGILFIGASFTADTAETHDVRHSYCGSPVLFV